MRLTDRYDKLSGMKVVIIAAMTADGYIGHHGNHFVDWTGPEDVKLFVRLTKEAGVVVMGSRTLETVQKAGRRLPGRRLVIYTTRPDEVTGERVETTDEEPAILVERLKSEGVNGIAICGGTSIYDQFMKAGVVDELHLSITPTLFGTGVPLFSAELRNTLSLQSAETLTDGTVALHYTVVK